MDEKLLHRYLEYANSQDAQAVLFVKKHLAQAAGHWVDILDCEQYAKSQDALYLRFVEGGLYKRRLRPAYPPKSDYMSDGQLRERDYYLATRAITWETAHTDIAQQKSEGLSPIEFKISGVSYDKSKHSKCCFRDDAPPAIMALAQNPNDRTDPLWAFAVQYLRLPEFVYKIKKLEIFDPRA